MPHLKFSQEHCRLVIDQQRGQRLQRPVVLAHAQKTYPGMLRWTLLSL